MSNDKASNCHHLSAADCARACLHQKEADAHSETGSYYWFVAWCQRISSQGHSQRKWVLNKFHLIRILQIDSLSQCSRRTTNGAIASFAIKIRLSWVDCLGSRKTFLDELWGNVLWSLTRQLSRAPWKAEWRRRLLLGRITTTSQLSRGKWRWDKAKRRLCLPSRSSKMITSK